MEKLFKVSLSRGSPGFFFGFFWFLFFLKRGCFSGMLLWKNIVISQYWFHQCYILSPVSLLKGSDVGSLLSGTIGIWTDNGLDYCLNDFDLLAMDT